MNRFAFIGIFFGLFAWAAEFPVREGNTDMVMLEDPNVHFAVEEWALARAKRSIDYICFLQVDDETGLRLINGFRNAANRGVKVRAALEKLSMPWSKKTSPAAYIADSELACPPGVACGTFLNKLKHGIAPDDWLHKKLVIIDAGTPNEIIISGGRNKNDYDLRSLDSGYVMRPLDSTKPHVGQDVRVDFEHFWKTFKGISGVTKPKPIRPEIKARLEQLLPEFIQTPAQRRQFAEVTNLLSRKPRDGDALQPFQFRPVSMQYLTNDIFDHLKRRPGNFGFTGRKNFPNAILDHAVKLLDQSTEAAFTSYVVGLPEPLQKAVVDNLRRGGHVSLYSNGRKAMERYFPKGMPVLYSYDNVLQMMDAAGENGNNLRLMTLDKDKAEALPAGHELEGKIYVHRKALLVKTADGKKVSLIGSDPYTKSSTYKIDENAFEIRDDRLYDYMKDQARREMPVYQTLERAEIARRRDAMAPSCSRLMYYVIQRLY